MIRSSQSNRWFSVAFFLGTFLYLLGIGKIGIPWAHPFADPLAIRDTGTMLPYLLSRPNPLRAVVLAILGHVEGPLQYVLLMAYSYAVDSFLPLCPSTMQFPNTIFAFLACMMAFFLGREVFGLRVGYAIPLVFALSPWLAHVVRMPWYFNTLACLFQLCTLYGVVAFTRNPESKRIQLALSLSLFGYLLVGMDWPSFLGTLLIYGLLSGTLSSILRNRFNIIPALYMVFLLVWGVLLYWYLGTEGFQFSWIVYPFRHLVWRVARITSEYMWYNTLVPWGPVLPLAFGGIVVYLFRLRRQPELDRAAHSLLTATSIWLVVGSVPLLISSGAPSYVYVLGVPSAIMGGLMLARLPRSLVAIFVVCSMVTQLFVITEGSFSFDQRRRILAAACFLVEERSDLLEKDKRIMATGMLPDQRFGDGMAVAQYARPSAWPINLQVDWPASRRVLTNRAHYLEVKNLVDTYNGTGKIMADVLILESEAYSDRNPARDFFRRLLGDPNVRWLARFRESNGEEIVIGEVIEGGAIPWEQVPLKDVDTLAVTYLKKYDRLHFLTRNVEFIKHY